MVSIAEMADKVFVSRKDKGMIDAKSGKVETLLRTRSHMLLRSKARHHCCNKKNICGKVTREPVKGSVEVYPIEDFGAIEIGLHKFYNNQEPIETLSKIGRFLIVWENKNIQWKIKRLVSLH